MRGAAALKLLLSISRYRRADAAQLIVTHTRKLGANAVIGGRYDTGPMVGAAEVLCYGRAVRVEPLNCCSAFWGVVNISPYCDKLLNFDDVRVSNLRLCTGLSTESEDGRNASNMF